MLRSIYSRRSRVTPAGGSPDFGRLEGRVIMVLWPRTLLFAFATTSACVCASFAQDANYASVTATPDIPVRLSYHASAHKNNCSPGALPTVHIIEAPKSGMLIVRQAMLTTNKIEGCPELKTPAQVVFYTANTDYIGPDHVKYEVTDENSQVATYDMTITVESAQPAKNPPAGTTEGQPQ
jgi:hypothetical protein